MAGGGISQGSSGFSRQASDFLRHEWVKSPSFVKPDGIPVFVLVCHYSYALKRGRCLVEKTSFLVN